MTIDSVLNQKYIEQEVLDQVEKDVSTFFQSSGIETLDIYAYEYIKPHRIAMDDVEDGITTMMIVTGEIIVDVTVKSKGEKVFLRQDNYVSGQFFKWDVTLLNGDHFSVKNKESFKDLRKKYLI